MQWFKFWAYLSLWIQRLLSFFVCFLFCLFFEDCRWRWRCGWPRLTWLLWTEALLQWEESPLSSAPLPFSTVCLLPRCSLWRQMTASWVGDISSEALGGSEAVKSPGHGLDLQTLLYAVGQRLLVVVFADACQHPLLVGFILVAARINLAWKAAEWTWR